MFNVIYKVLFIHATGIGLLLLIVLPFDFVLGAELFGFLTGSWSGCAL